MADISKCMGRNCERRETCYRYTAPENQYRQSYTFFDDDPKKCEHYWPIEVRNAKSKAEGQ